MWLKIGVMWRIVGGEERANSRISGASHLATGQLTVRIYALETTGVSSQQPSSVGTNLDCGRTTVKRIFSPRIAQSVGHQRRTGLSSRSGVEL